MGRSGARLSLVVRKEGNGLSEEAAYCHALGDVAPRIFACSDGAYYMELLQQAPRKPDLPRRVEALLGSRVWCYKPIYPNQWCETMLDGLVGIPIPNYAYPDDLCRVHGDPTLANTLIRADHGLVIADPVPPRRVPQIQEIDEAEILQSMLGWEVVISGVEPVVWEPCDFMLRYENHSVLYWCGVALLRARQHEKHQHVISWIDTVAPQLFKMADV